MGLDAAGKMQSKGDIKESTRTVTLDLEGSINSQSRVKILAAGKPHIDDGPVYQVVR